MEERLQKLQQISSMKKGRKNSEDQNMSQYDHMSSNTKETYQDGGSSMINYREMDQMGNSGIGFAKQIP